MYSDEGCIYIFTWVWFWVRCSVPGFYGYECQLTHDTYILIKAAYVLID